LAEYHTPLSQVVSHPSNSFRASKFLTAEIETGSGIRINSMVVFNVGRSLDPRRVPNPQAKCMLRLSLSLGKGDLAVIPAPIAYMKVAAVKKLVVGFRLE
jgi:hypothetical protein